MSVTPIDILLIEDNEDDIELTQAALSIGKVVNSLTVFRDGDKALRYLLGDGTAANPPCAIPGLILLDLRLPKVDGIEVLKRIKQEPTLRRVPVVVLTTSQRDEDIIQSYDFGANSFIRKPVLFETFHTTMKTLELYWVLTNIPPPMSRQAKQAGDKDGSR